MDTFTTKVVYRTTDGFRMFYTLTAESREITEYELDELYRDFRSGRLAMLSVRIAIDYKEEPE